MKDLWNIATTNILKKGIKKSPNKTNYEIVRRKRLNNVETFQS